MTCIGTRVDLGDAGLGPEIRLGSICVWSGWGSCDAIGQTGCAAGHACYPATLPTCLPAGTLARGAECFDVADCAPGLACVAVPGGGAACRTICASDGDCVEGERCEGLPSSVGVCGEAA